MSCGRSALSGLMLVACSASCLAAEPDDTGNASDPVYQVVIVAPYGGGVDRDLVPANVQRADQDDIDRLQPLDLSDLLNRSFGSVNINQAQNNPLQPDLNFRGFTASPLLGLPIGLSVYQNGVRINEPFGDTINWDLISPAAIADVQMIAGANPVFGLNTLGGALSVRMKNGFNFHGTDATAIGGSFGRQDLIAETGGNNGTWGYYANADYFQEDGWRDFSASNALRLFGAMSYRGDGTSLDLSLSHADTKLRGNGSAPAELLAEDREAVFTYPDITQNKLTQLILEGTRDIASEIQLAGNAYYRDVRTQSFNGDSANFGSRDLDGEAFLVAEEDDEAADFVRDQNGHLIPAEIDDRELNAINNISTRRQKGYGFSGQMTFNASVLSRKNSLIAGVAWSKGETDYTSSVEVAALTEDRGTTRTAIFAPDFGTAVNSDVDTSSVYFVDTLSFTDRLALTLAGRYNNIRTKLRDQSGITPELDGDHGFKRFNPATGLAFKLPRDTSAYASYGESARAPSPVELACASEDAPCNLPNAFLADPPLKQVVARNFELGFRGSTAGNMHWNVDYFYTLNRDDILFQTTGGAQANVGFFQNAADTRRTGLELEISQRISRVSWSADYSYVKATFEDAFVVDSPNHPLAAGELLVPKGATIPGVPRHQVNLALDVSVTQPWSIGGDMNLRSGVYLRGDEANLLNKTDAFAVFNLHSQFQLGEHALLLARIENVFDKKYETFGILGRPQEVFPSFTDPRFYGAGPPRGAWVGVKVKL